MKEEILRMEHVYVGEKEPYLLHNFKLNIVKGEIINLIGLSGAGKTLILNYFNGGVKLQAGRVVWNKKEYKAQEAFQTDPLLICIGQKSTLVEKMTIAENIFILSRRKKMGFYLNRKHLDYRAKLLLSEYAKDLSSDMLVAELTPFERHVVQLLRAIVNESHLVIIDDIFQSYGSYEMMQMKELLLKLKEKNISVLYQSHRSDFLMQISDKIVIVRKGMNVRTFYQADYSEELATQLLLGNEWTDVEKRVSYQTDKEALLVKNYSCGEKVKNINLIFHEGEVVGLYDPENIANKELALSFIGDCPVKEGEIIYQQERYVPKNLDDAISKNIGYIPRDMSYVSLVDSMSFMDNLFLPVMKKTSRIGMINDYSVLDFLCKEYMEDLGIRYQDRNKPVKCFDAYIHNSILLTRWQLFRPSVMVCIEPCANADILMQSIIHNAIGELAKQKSVVIISSPDINELRLTCDRIYELSKQGCHLRIEKKKEE